MICKYLIDTLLLVIMMYKVPFNSITVKKVILHTLGSFSNTLVIKVIIMP